MVNGQRATLSGTKRCTMTGKTRSEVKWTTFRTILSDERKSLPDCRKQLQKLLHHANFSVLEDNTASGQFRGNRTTLRLRVVLDFWQRCHKNHATWWRARYKNHFPHAIKVDYIERAILCSAIQWCKVNQRDGSIKQFGRARGFGGVGGFIVIALLFCREQFFVYW